MCLSRFSVKKSAAKVSKEDSRRPPCKSCPVSATPTNALRALVNSRGVHELVAGSSAWQVCAAQKQCKSRRFYRSPQLHATTRANISHEKAEQIRARIVCTPAERGLTHMRSMCVGVAETGLGGRGEVCALTKARIFANLLQWEKVSATG